MNRLIVSKGELKEMQQFEKDVIFFEKQRKKLYGKYPDRWVAVFDEKIVGVSKELVLLLKHLKKRKIPSGKVAIEYLSSKEEAWILRIVG